MPASLPLTAFESYMWADDAPGHPTTALIEVGFAGRLDRAGFEAALSETLGQHPLLRSLIDVSRRRPRWVTRPDAKPFLSWEAEEKPLGYPGGSESIDLRREIGLRFWVRAGERSGRVVLQLHHACTDGVGVTNFVLDLLRAYDRRQGGSAAAPARDERLLAVRDRFFRRPWLGRVRLMLGLAGRVSKWRRARPVMLGDGGDGAASGGPMSAIRVRSLDGRRLEGLLRAAHAADVTLNDVLLRDLFVVLRDRCGGVGPDECLCVAMPVNLRTADDAAMPAANKITLSLLRRPPEACDDPAGLLRDLRRETLEVKTTHRGVRLLEVLRAIVAVTGRVPQRFLRKSLATVVLTNLGRVGGREAGLPADAGGRLLCGGLVIDRIVTAPNGRPGTSAVVCVLTYGGRLHLSLWFDARVLSEAGAEQLLDDYVARLSETARGVSPEHVG